MHSASAEEEEDESADETYVPSSESEPEFVEFHSDEEPAVEAALDRVLSWERQEKRVLDQEEKNKRKKRKQEKRAAGIPEVRKKKQQEIKGR